MSIGLNPGPFQGMENEVNPNLRLVLHRELDPSSGNPPIDSAWEYPLFGGDEGSQQRDFGVP